MWLTIVCEIFHVKSEFKFWPEAVKKSPVKVAVKERSAAFLRHLEENWKAWYYAVEML